MIERCLRSETSWAAHNLPATSLPTTMSQPRLSPLWIMFLLWVLFGALLAATYDQWPEHVATHFNLEGDPDGWMGRETNIAVYLALGFAMPLILYGIFSLVGIFPTRFVNMPQRDYWLAPERKAVTMRELRRQSLWLGCLMLLFFAGLYVLALEANQQNPVKLSVKSMLLLLGGFLSGVAVWVVLFYRRFWKAE
jgi:serine/threonine-protein kinase